MDESKNSSLSVKKTITGISLLTVLFFFLHTEAGAFSRPPVRALHGINRWFILLNESPETPLLSKARLKSYQMAILDSDLHPPLELFDKNTVTMAYVSIGEAESYRPYWKTISGAPWILKENENWKNNYFVDVRSAEWHAVLLDQVIPGILKQGFRGIFLDTLDTAEYLESLDPDHYGGSKEAMIGLVKAIKKKYPDLLLISNNGFSILNEMAPVLDGLLAESVCTMIDFKKGIYQKNTETDRLEKTVILRELSKQYELPVFVVEYVSDNDQALKNECLQSDHDEGFNPYFAEKELSRLHD